MRPRRYRKKVPIAMPTIETVAQVIKLPVRQWRNRCHEIACKMLFAGLVVGIERYGHYYGPVSPKHHRYGLPFQPHGWIETPDRLVIDPTRWAFEMVKPYIYFDIGTDYDPGGQRASHPGDYPADPCDALRDLPHLKPHQEEMRRKIFQLDIAGPARDHLATLTGGQVTDFSFDQVFWLTHVPVSSLGDHAQAIYGALAKAGCKAMIPFDCWRMVMEEPMASNFS